MAKLGFPLPSITCSERLLFGSGGLQMRQGTCSESLCLFIVKEGEHVVSLLDQLSAFSQPFSYLAERKIEDVPLDPIAEKTWNGLHDKLPSVLGRALV
jgi:hypothetical protein